MTMARSVSPTVIPIDAGSPKQSPPGRWVGACDAVLIYGCAAVLMFGVLAFGAVETWSTFILETGATALFAVWVVRQLGARTIRVSANALYLPAVGFFLAVGTQLVLHISAYPFVTQYEFGKYIAYGVFLFLGGECYREQSSARKIVLLFTVFGGLYAAFAIVQGLEGNGKLYWVRSPQYGGWIYGSYVHHGHYAGLIEMLVPLALIVGTSHLLRPAARGLVLFAGCVMAASIFLSAARGGMFAFLAEIVIAMVLLSLVSSRNRRKPVLPLLAMLALIALLVAIGSRGQVFARFGELNLLNRTAVLRDIAHMWTEKPVLGWGLGTFPTVYPRFRSFYTTANVNAAHNDYAQVLAEMGAVGAGLTLWFLVALYRKSRPHTWRWQTEWRRNLQFAALVGCTGILVHALGDFNLQIPANAAMFYFLAGIAASPRRPESDTEYLAWEWES